jgi:tRNA (guanine37-N1)-methyltransferase
LRDMKFAILTIFPEMVDPFLNHGIVRLAVERGQIEVEAINIRDFASGRHRVTDDKPYGGGCGMVMKPEPLMGAIAAARQRHESAQTVLLSPQGRTFDRGMAHRFADMEGLILVCGRYEGIDERVLQNGVDLEVSTGDFVMTGGELAAMTIIDAVTRLIPGVLGGEESAAKDSFEGGLLEHAHYTRPSIFEGEAVPDVLLSGNHRDIEDWRTESSLVRTLLKRPDLLKAKALSDREKDILRKWCHTLEELVRE